MSGNVVESITLTVPANARHAATARVTAASLAADLGFGVDDIDDLRVAINEAVALLVDDPGVDDPGVDDPGVHDPATTSDDGTADHGRNGDAERLEVEFLVAPAAGEEASRLEVVVRRPGASGAPPDELAERILSAVVDRHEHGAGFVRLVKSASDHSESR